MGGDVMEEIYETRFIPPLKKRIADLEAALVSETTRANDAVERASRNAIACNRQEERAEAAEAELKHARERAEVPCAGIGSDEVGCPKTLHLARYRTVRANEDDTLAYRCSDCGQTFCLSCLRLHFAARKEQATDAVEAELTGYIELDEALKEQAPAERCPGCVADAEPGVWRRIVPHNLDCESKAPAGGTGVSERTAPGRDADPPPNPAGPRILGQLARDGLVANQPPAPAFWCLSDGSCQNGCQGLPCHCDDCEACCGCTAGPAAHRVPRLRAESILSGDARLPGSMSHLPKGRVSGDD